LDLVRRSACPSGLPVAVERGGLHLGLLVFVGKEISGKRRSALLKLSAGRRLDQRAHVGHHRQMLLVEQTLQLGEFGMEPNDPALGALIGSRLPCARASTERID